jgi:signal transduction histidine kinase
MEEISEDISSLQRCINDLISVLALPALWAGRKEERIISALLDAIIGMLRLDFAYVRLRDPMSGSLVEMVRHDHVRHLMVEPRAVGQILNDSLGANPREWPRRARNPFGDGNLSIIPLGAGRNDEIAVIVAGSRRDDFPRRTETVLLNVAANQAAIGLASARAYELERQAEEALRADLARMNRVSMMGELAASLTHEITQPIGSARNNARAAQNFLDMQPPRLDEVGEALGSIVGNIDRAGDIIERIREHMKKAPPRKERLDLNAAINQVMVLARSAIIGSGISVQTRLADGLFLIQGDRVQLQQVILNLILNAVEAIGSVEAGPRDLLISTELDHTGVLVAVRDSGPGIDPTHLERVFEAFYTTKSSGLGMGLSICRSIIEAHGGRLWASANVPRGAMFQFTVPAHSDITS